MSLPRAVLPNSSYLITRRCSQRQFLMRPDKETNNAFVYCLALAAERHKVKVMFYVAMSNHYHAGVIDTLGQLPEFLAYFHRLFAKHQNALRGRSENFWSASQTSVVELTDGNDALSAMVYTLCNPAKDHLVETAEIWPGASSYSATIKGTKVIAKRPSHFFQKTKGLAAEISLALSPLLGHEHIPREQFLILIRDLIAKREQDAREERKRLGITVLGVLRVLRQRWQDRPRARSRNTRVSQNPAPSSHAFATNHRSRNKTWLHEYRVAREKYILGEEVTFPAGTYWLRRFAGAKCVPMPGEA